MDWVEWASIAASIGAFFGAACLFTAAANLGLVENVELLLAHGADATLQSKVGESALSLAERPDSSVARVERRQVVELLTPSAKATFGRLERSK